MGGSRRIPDLVQGLPKTQAALAYAGRMHAGQSRTADGAPFIAHPLEVASLLYYAGASDHLIAAGALHDVIERTDADASELRGRFGRAVAALVVAVSEDDRIVGYAARKAALREQAAKAGPEALTLFAADKISKVRELRMETARAARSREQSARLTQSGSRRLAHYKHCLRLLEERLPDSRLVGQLRAELERLSGKAVGQLLPVGAP